MNRLSTGVPILDRRLDGGLPPGSLTTLTASPESQSELLVNAFADSGPTHYVTSLRSPAAVRSSLVDAGLDQSTLTVYDVDPNGLVSDPGAALRDLPDGGRLIVDPISSFERLDSDAQREAYTAIGELLERRDGVGLFHAAQEGPLDPSRGRTLAFSDIVCRLQLTRTPLSIDNRLYVTKFRGGAALTEPIKIKLTDRVRIDTSRDIA